MLLQQQQKGMTFLGYVIVLGIIGFFVLMALKLTPLYLEYQSVTRIMNNLADQTPSTATPAAIRNTIQKRLNVNNIERVKAQDFKISRARTTTEVSLSYEARTQFVGNIWFLLVFDHSVTLRGS